MNCFGTTCNYVLERLKKYLSWCNNFTFIGFKSFRYLSNAIRTDVLRIITGLGAVLNYLIIRYGKVVSGSLLSHPANSFIDLGDMSSGRLCTGDSSSSVFVSLLALSRG